VSVLLVLLTIEAGLRAIDEMLSLDIIHIRKIPTITKKMMAGPRPRLMFLGNSMTRRGIREDVFVERMRAHHIEPLTVARVFPDNTQIAEWYYAFKKYAVDAGRIPDFLVINCPTEQLTDLAPYSIYALASTWTRFHDLHEVFQQDITNFGDRVEFLISMYSTAFANRNRVRGRVLYTLIPHYPQAARQINQVLRKSKQEATASGHVAVTYHRLKRLIHLARRHHVQLIIAAIPVIRKYEIDPHLVELLQNEDVPLVDCRRTPGIDQTSFRDGLHLNEQGAATYPRYLADQLAPILRSYLAADAREAVTR